MTAIVVLAESHASLYTYPEAGYAAIDVFTCGGRCNPVVAVDELVALLGAESVLRRVIERGRQPVTVVVAGGKATR